jgi:hypothetical protein
MAIKCHYYQAGVQARYSGKTNNISIGVSESHSRYILTPNLVKKNHKHFKSILIYIAKQFMLTKTKKKIKSI